MDFSAQERLTSPRYARPVTLIGHGSVGSWVWRLLPKVGVTDLTLYEHDDVASHNIPAGNFDVDDLGRDKARVAESSLRRGVGLGAKIVPERYVGQPLRGSVICCVDRMSQRAVAWKAARAAAPMVDFFVDTRTHERYVHVMCVNPGDPDQVRDYEALLCSDKEAEPPICGLGNNPLTAVPAAWAAVNLLTRAWKGDTTVWQFRMLTDVMQQQVP